MCLPLQRIRRLIVWEKRQQKVLWIIVFIDDVISNFASGRQTDVLIMDFSKAFDKVGHSLLIKPMILWDLGQCEQLDREFTFQLNSSWNCQRGNVQLRRYLVESTSMVGSWAKLVSIYHINDMLEGHSKTTLLYLTVTSQSDTQTF